MKYIWIIFLCSWVQAKTTWTEKTILKEIKTKGPKVVEATEAAANMKLKSAVFPMVQLLSGKFHEEESQDGGTKARIMFLINSLVEKKDVRKVIDLYERYVPFSREDTFIAVRETNLELQMRDPFRMTPDKLLKALGNNFGEFRWGIIESAGELARKDKRYYPVLRKGLSMGYFERDYALDEVYKLPREDIHHFREELLKCERSAIEEDHKARCKAMLAR